MKIQAKGIWIQHYLTLNPNCTSIFLTEISNGMLIIDITKLSNHNLTCKESFNKVNLVYFTNFSKKSLLPSKV